jgi:hypothetical protein
MSFKIAILALLLVSVFSMHITSQQAHRQEEEADLTGSDGDDNDDSGLSEEEAEAKAFEEFKNFFGLPDDFQWIDDTSDSNSESHKFWGNFAAEMKKYCADPKNKKAFSCKKKH